MSTAHPILGERAIGWTAHYIIEVGYGPLLAALAGRGWLQQPTLLAPIILGIILLAAPYFIMMPGMGIGVAGSRTPNPNVTRLRSPVGHTVFGLRMYGTALGSGLVLDHSQNRTVAANAIAERYVSGHLS